MIKTLLLAGSLLACLAGAQALAQEPPAPVAESAVEAEATPNQVLEPFLATYTVFREGRALGRATMQVVRQQSPRWRVDLVMHGTGLLRLAGINAEQSTVFDVIGETYRPLTQATVRKTLFTRKQSIGLYDWRSKSGNWTGDIKESRRDPVPLQAGDMSGLLINLAVIRDAEPGKQLAYRFVDNGRVKPHRYVVAADQERISVDDLTYNAMRVDRVQDDNEETVIWVAKGVPTPIRMLQREDGHDTYDLRLVEYRGVP